MEGFRQGRTPSSNCPFEDMTETRQKDCLSRRDLWERLKLVHMQAVVFCSDQNVAIGFLFDQFP